MNTNAAIIQNGYRAYLWRLLIYASIVNNRARRIQRGFRAHQYRVWVWNQVTRSDFRKRQRLAFMLQRAYSMMILNEQFEARREILAERKKLEINNAKKIQHCYRSYVIYKAYIKEKLRKFYSGQRMKTEAVMKAVRTMQRLYRLVYRPELAPHHLKLCGVRSVRDDMYLYWRKAFAIQKVALIHIDKQRKATMKKQTAAANKLWYFSKSFLLRLVIYYRIIATRIKRNNAATLLKKNYHLFLWYRVMRERCQIRTITALYHKLLNVSAFTIQCMIRRKMTEYFMPLRVAGRYLRLS